MREASISAAGSVGHFNKETRMKTKVTLPVLFALILLAVAGTLPGQAPAPDSSLLTLDRIFSSRDFAAERFGPARWLKDGETYTTLEASAAPGGGRDIILYRADNGKREILVAAGKLIPQAASNPLAIENYEWSADGLKLLVFTNSKRVWRQNTRGDFWVLDRASGRLRKLGKDFPASTLMFAKFSPDGTRVAYVQNNDIYAEDLASGTVLRLTWDGNGTIINGTSDWVYEEEFGLRDGFRWNPDGRSIAFWQFDTSGVPEFSMIDNTSALYPKIVTFQYPKVGQTNSACRVGVVSLSGGYPVWMNPGGDPRNTYIPVMEWAGDSSSLIFERLNRLQNANDVMIGDAATGKTHIFFTDRDDAWVEAMNVFIWIDGGKSLLWLSEREGWRRAYAVSRLTGRLRPVTADGFDVLNLDFVDEKGGWLYFTASPEDATKRALYRARLDGKGKAEAVSLAGQKGAHSYEFSPTGRWAFHTYSSLDTPPLIELVRLPKHDVVRPLAPNTALRAKIETLKRTRAEFFRLDIGGGVQVDGWCIKPPDFDPARKYPLFIQVYGEPAGQTVQDRWGGSGYLWHLMLAQKGYIVASFDNHGTPAPRGREWRKSIYRQIGILASADQAAAAKAFLAARPYADPARVGIWGWSGGGSMTLNAMFRYPDIYATGISVASVPNQRFYDSIYQERYMGLPGDNSDGFRDGSPLTFAKNLKGHLLIIHGTGDDNVHYQGFETLVNELIAQGKQFTMMSYPNRSHGIYEGPGTTMHLYTLMTDYLLANLPPGGK
jgi:dipeptidyl-peptidase-4